MNKDDKTAYVANDKTLSDSELNKVSGGRTFGGPACPYCGCPNISIDQYGEYTCLACQKHWK